MHVATPARAQVHFYTEVYTHAELLQDQHTQQQASAVLTAASATYSSSRPHVRVQQRDEGALEELVAVERKVVGHPGHAGGGEARPAAAAQNKQQWQTLSNCCT
jgi:hypothetical protein